MSNQPARPAGLEQAYAEFAADDAEIVAKKKEIDARSAELTSRAQALEKRKEILMAEIQRRKELAAAAEKAPGLHPAPDACSSAPPSPPSAEPPAAAAVAGNADLGWASRPSDVLAVHREQAEAMANATVLITGPTAGIGVHTAVALASFAGRVVLAARNEAKAEALIAKIRSCLPQSSTVQLTFLPLDLTSLESVTACASRFLELQASERWPPLKALVLNAGVYTFSGRYESSSDGYERTFAVNHLAHFLLLMKLMPALEAARPSRVVVVGSGSQFGPHVTKDVTSAAALAALATPSEAYRRRFWHAASARAYGSSKLCNTMFARSVHGKYFAAKGVACCSLHPGTLMRSDMARDSPIANFVLKHVLSWFTKDLEQGAATSIYCCLAPHGALGGAFYSDCRQAACSPLVTDEACEVLWDYSLSLCASHLQ